MERLYRPYLLFFTVTLPQLLLLVLFSRVYHIINTELSKEALHKWKIFFTALMIGLIVITLHAIWLVIKKKKIPPLWAAGLMGYVFLVSFYFFGETSMIPVSIDSWMLMGISPSVVVLTLIMPALGHGMLLLVHLHVERYGAGSLSKDTAMMMAIPLLWYMGANVVFGILSVHSIPKLIQSLVLIIFVVSILMFFFLFIRILYGILIRKSDMWRKYLLVVVSIGSLTGLALNQTLSNMFGNFSHPIFYILNLLIIVLLWLPKAEQPRIRLALFIAKAITLAYTLYFAIVFLPYLPLSILGIIFVGLGGLLLIPLMLLFMHIQSLWLDFEYLKETYKSKRLTILFVAGLMVIPLVLTVTVYQDQYHLDRGLNYVYRRSYQEPLKQKLNPSAMKRAIDNIKYSASTDLAGFDGLTRNNNIPYLSALYRYFVLDNLTISRERINRLEAIFYGEQEELNTENQNSSITRRVRLTEARSETSIDEATGHYRSWIHLTLKNNSYAQEEYITTLRLPEGSYISDYYLYVGPHKKYGLLADKRAANWAYQQVRNIRKDPGLLTYTSSDLVEFKVFPFAPMETRETGIEIIHRAPMELYIDGKTLQLGQPQEGENRLNIDPLQEYPWLAYITREEKEGLRAVKRQPAYYFLIDYSKAGEGLIQDYHQRVEEYIKDNRLENTSLQIIAVNYQEKVLDINHHEGTLKNELPLQGGFNLDYSIKKIYYQHYMENSDYYPVVIVVSNYFHRAIKPENFQFFQFTAPEGSSYYHLDLSGNLYRHSLLDSRLPMDRQDKIETPLVLHWRSPDGKSYYLPDNQQDTLLLLSEPPLGQGVIRESKWNAGVILKAMHMAHMLKPEEGAQINLAMVKNSIANEVMGPMTSFIVLETEAQEKAMLQRQKDLLATNKALDINDFVQMNEPSLLILCLLTGVFICIRRRKKA